LSDGRGADLEKYAALAYGIAVLEYAISPEHLVYWGDLVSGRPQSRFPTSSCRHFMVARHHLAHNHLDCGHRDRLSKMRMAGVDPIDLNPVGSAIILVVGSLGGILLFSKRMLIV
jgi:hypothetical protein